MVAAVTIVVVLMGVISAVSNLGWHWLSGLANPGTVVSWLDPATALGLAMGHAASALGVGGHTAGLVDISRGVGLGLAAVLSVLLLLRSTRWGEVDALGWSLLLFVVLGPVVWPWYETWGFVVLAVVAEGWTLRLVLALSAVACFADVPVGPFPRCIGPSADGDLLDRADRRGRHVRDHPARAVPSAARDRGLVQGADRPPIDGAATCRGRVPAKLALAWHRSRPSRRRLQVARQARHDALRKVRDAPPDGG